MTTDTDAETGVSVARLAQDIGHSGADVLVYAATLALAGPVWLARDEELSAEAAGRVQVMAAVADRDKGVPLSEQQTLLALLHAASARMDAAVGAGNREVAALMRRRRNALIMRAALRQVRVSAIAAAVGLESGEVRHLIIQRPF